VRRATSIVFVLLLAAPSEAMAEERMLLKKSPDSDGAQEIFCVMHTNPKKVYITVKNNTDYAVHCDIRCDVTKDKGEGTFALHSRGAVLQPKQDTSLISGFRNADGYYTGILGGEYRCLP
jgi:hypothetical protein